MGSDLKHFGVCCEGHHHDRPHFPAATSSTQSVRLKGNGVSYQRCRDNLRAIDRLVVKYKRTHGRYPAHLAYLVELPGIRLPSCDQSQAARPAKETDYAIMQTPGNYHLICTSVSHLEAGFSPIQPGLINSLPPKAMFLLQNKQTGKPRLPRFDD